ncbi:Bardet-Biedl syndrome 1 protein-like [Daphnia carinata]|uniref:Bardet-Biedl syndrome 1 protein-like n=1 Tax=Daphnia carinata TaxID=120202 RepID=UPI00257E88D4|nr:Bardet-Biedl syndrome 1 protein-like [Daphnia carinata]
MSRNQLWLDACRNSSVNLKSECGVVLLDVEDLAKDGINRLLALLVGYELSHLKIFNGTDLQCEITLPEMAVAICTFNIDGSPPGIAVGAGSSLYIYKNFKPYYKYNIPHGGPNYTEQVEITQLAALSRSTPDVSCSSLLLVGTGHNSLLIIDPQTFNAISRIELADVPTSIKSSGYYDMEAIILVGTPDAGVFILRSDQKPLQPKPFLPPRSPIVEIAFNGTTIAIATSDYTIRYYTLQGQELRKIVVDTFILAIAWIQPTNQDLCLLAVSLSNGQVHFYRQGILIEQLHFKTSIVSMTFGRYGREDGTLVMVSKDGELFVKILNRGYKMAQQTDLNVSSKPSISICKRKALGPAKTKLFVDQTMREKEDPAKMYQLFQEGMCRLHLRALREWLNFSSSAKADVEQLAPVPEESRCLHLVAKLLGTGSRFMLHLLLQNISDQVIDSLTVMLQITDGKLVLERSSAKISLMLPAAQHWIKINVKDPTNQGGEVSVIVRKEAEPDFELTIWGSIVCTAKINISPTI